jgi:hypothetical protein
VYDQAQQLVANSAQPAQPRQWRRAAHQRRRLARHRDPGCAAREGARIELAARAEERPLHVMLRVYWPKQEVIDGRWNPPGIRTAT